MLGKKKKQNIDIEKINDEDSARHLELLRDVLENTQANIKKALNLINKKEFDVESLLDSLERTKEASEGFVVTNGANIRGNGSERIVEGVFNGEKMLSGDGIEFNIPANYASKSKLIEGDILKLTIRKDGSFIYKQIGPVERMQLVATLASNEKEGEWYALEGKKRWKLLTASVTYFHGQPGDEVVILIPKDSESDWAAVENVIKNGK
jgi:hypothetical protein